MFAILNSQQRAPNYLPIGQNDAFTLDFPNVTQEGANRQPGNPGYIDCVYLSYASIPNNFDEVHCDLIVTEPGPAVTVTLQLRGYFSFSRFATYLAAALNASALTGVYTVVFAPAPYAQYTITSTVPFSFDLTRPARDTRPLEDPSVHLGLERIVTPVGLSITSTKPVILNVNMSIFLTLSGLGQGQGCGGYGNRFTFAIQVDKDKDQVISHTGRRYTQFINVSPDFFQGRSTFTVNLTRADGGTLYNLADYSVVVRFAKYTPYID